MRIPSLGTALLPLRHLAFAFGCVVALPASAAQTVADIILYEQENFLGRSFTSTETFPNFNSDWGGGGASAIVRAGSWQVCTEVFFRGRCETLRTGQYPTLRSMRLDGPIVSAREVEWQSGPAAGPGGPPPRPGGPGPGPGGPAPQGQVELYEFDGFNGRAFAVNEATDHFPNDFNDRASSMIIHSGNWEACENIRYGGRCQVFGPGRYANLGGMANRISSIRPVGGPAPGGPGPGGPGPGGGWGHGARAMLYEHANFGGRTFVLNNEVASNFANSGFNDRASSLRIEGGYWMFCSDANFQGECLTFGPGDYPSLPPSLNNRISSGRRIRDYYPYSQTPNWQR
jgi:hypothetical protein